ncbi:hypothetical protein FPZ43_09015 [Mucilaginibacter pallidiroseus]|uniref:Uncharacterized protein n=1 Tax=Mucilaginibacter pallidiroseus TaxID=2599295 RepID=A0A563UF39_9SPHI|nr:hypothetical protein [Mucilaginibacter pallidiroseus]TWR29977.1 hypothetical protein FPZ43_09015 [Mucilaginibacter pallidiroseus]
MNKAKYLIVLALALSAMACKKRKAINFNVQHVDSAIKADSLKALGKTDTSEMPGDAKIPLAQLIVPGSSLGQSTINESSENIYKRLGKPDAGDAAMGKSTAIWYADHDTTKYATQMYFSRDMGNDDAARLKHVRVTSPAFKINNSLYVGQPLKPAMEKYNLVKVGTFGHRGNVYTLYDDKKAGVAFDVDGAGNISGITVHEPGRDVKATYLPFFNNLKAM